MHDANNGTNRFVSGFSRTQRREKTVEEPFAAYSHVRKATRPKKKEKKEKKKKRKKNKKGTKCALENSGISDPGIKKK